VIRLSGGLVVTMDRTGREIPSGVVEVDGGVITHVGPDPSDSEADEVVDLSGTIVLPGLVNTHCHTSQQLGRGLADDVDLLTWLRDRIWPYEAALSEADSEVSALACAIEQIRSGVTLLADPGGQHVDGMARGIAASGMRAVLGRSSMDSGEGLPPAMVEPTADVLAAQDDLATRWHGSGDGRLMVGTTLRTIFNCSDELILATVARAQQSGIRVQMHIAEVPEENEFSTATRGTSTVRHLHRIGALGPWFLGVHAVWVDDEEIGLLASSGAAVSHNVASNLKILGFPRIADMVDAGVTVGVGTDGAPSNNRMCLLDEMWAGSMVQKALRRDPTVLPARTWLRMATIDGARAIGLAERTGSLEVGKWADLVVMDPDTVNMTPVHDPVAGVITSAKSENVRDVMCAGQWVLRDRELPGVDERAVLSEARGRAAAVAARIGR
jgi:5-methylthioadenosine/S-adenosylhomocysteine deaminase